MVFSSVTFLIWFLPIVWGVYFLIPKKLRQVRNVWLLLASLAFYGASGARFLVLMLVTITVNYVGGVIAAYGKSKAVRRGGMIGALVINLGLLGYYKYAGFFTSTLNSIGLPVKILEVVLPVGISFFIFQGLSYVIDVYRGDAQCQKNPLWVALYVSLFPQLVAGPIVRYTDVDREISVRNETAEKFAAGFTRFCFGMAKKMFLANPMGEIADAIWGFDAASLPAGTAWVGLIAYTMQIYFDFSAYSDMAIGIGKTLGFNFLENFNYPYIATSVTDFWRRWHISLSTWFRDYVYIPLGGNRCSAAKQIRNMTVVWLLTGLWHGASWSFVFWGAWFLVFLIGEKYIWGKMLAKLPSVFGWALTLFTVMISWVFFRSPDLGYAWTFIYSLFGAGGGIGAESAVYYLRQYLPEFCIGIIACLPVRDFVRSRLEKREDTVSRLIYIWAPKLAAMGLLLISYAELLSGSFNPFIYFQF